MEFSTPPTLRGRVEVDVGGKRFFTSRATLSSKPGFFRALCEGTTEIEFDQDGCIFLDRDPTAFRFILNHLQNQLPPLSELSPAELETLRLDALFYELEELQEALSIRTSQQSHSSTVIKPKPQEERGGESDLVAKTLSIECEIQKATEAIESAESRLEMEMASFERLREKISQSVSSEKIKLQLMTADIQFCTTLRTLTAKPGSYFAAKFSSRDRWEGDLEDDGSVFIERDDIAFRHLLNHLRGYPSPQELTMREKEALRNDEEYYQLSLGFAAPFSESQILSDRASVDQLVSWLQPQETNLLYRGSRDGFTADDFLSRCHGLPRTVVLLKARDGTIFGGFADVPWASRPLAQQFHMPAPRRRYYANADYPMILDRRSKPASASFLFSLCNSRAEVPWKIESIRPFSLSNTRSSGISFGNDLVVDFGTPSPTCRLQAQSYRGPSGRTALALATTDFQQRIPFIASFTI